ncbi:IspD/TarI family cytidylyltransferase [Reinekea marinisedimentorum]|uniref:2-C-methyl-D-erythritol 4-phosphate cytidylyltransferase n=1 Tax=Reinekea marinisedimentorum TaxID=230495 RepID=A0A4R3I6M5_9GAMM|nr:2-C-methyl-D-erythritol 4-phosphate cytidylyltransferase [Reinekea marinisedimentorum]TCS40730.1 2-C-methyl-D-erythritol 4-phosphate cytidylyltransferase [Reinekea marinisedimentorum]
MAVHFLFPAGGVGSRFGSDQPKQLTEIAGRAVMAWTLNACFETDRKGRAFIGLSAEDAAGQAIAAGYDELEVFTAGGERFETVLNGLNHMLESVHPFDWVLVHDIARPCVQAIDIQRLIDTVLVTQMGGILCQPITDTVKQASSLQGIPKTIDRSTLCAAQTPQCFRVQELRDALRKALDDGVNVTDEASAIEHISQPMNLVVGSSDNIKLTHPEDAALVEFYLTQQGRI